MQALAARPACARRASHSRVEARASAIRSVRRDPVAGKGFQEVFAIDLLANGRATEQALTCSDGVQLVGLEIMRPLGIVFVEQRRLNETICVVEELLPGSNALAAGARAHQALATRTCAYADAASYAFLRARRCKWATCCV